jgi:hypothetical protein
MIEVAQKYIDLGLSVIPCRKDKKPIAPNGWKGVTFDAESFRGVEYIGIMTGERSGGLEVFDFDNKFKDAKEVLNKFVSVPEVWQLYEKYKFPIELTQNGGYHLLFKCDKIDGNRELTRRWSETENRVMDLIETRGEGGYIVASPSPGYKIVKNDISEIPRISILERSVLFEVAISLNEYFPKPIQSTYEGKDRPGDVYNQKDESIEEAKKFLKDAGWSEIGNYNWRRPDKKDGTSATFGKVAPNIFYVFSSSAYPFEQEKAYTPFQILALLKFNGDFNEAAKSLPQSPNKQEPKSGWVERKKPEFDEDTLQKLLTNSFIDITHPVEHPPTILSMLEIEGSQWVERRLFTLGNFSCIIGKAKSKKTFLMSLVTAALMKNDILQEHLKGKMDEKKSKILYFDTEQGEYDSHNCIKRIIRIAGTSSNLFAFNLRPFSPMERCQLVEYAFKHWGENVGFCVIDGIADLANAINDEEEATRVATMLLRLTKNYNCHISTVIHQNKNDNFATGHLGSSIMKKAEILISVTKDVKEKNKSIVSCDMSRSVDFSDFEFEVDYNGMPGITRTNVTKEIETAFWNESKEKEDAPY